MSNASNLKRGNVAPKDAQRESMALARKKLEENRAADKAISEELTDPGDAVLVMFREATLSATRGLRLLNKPKKDGQTDEEYREASRRLLDTVREARQLAAAAAEVLKAQGRASEAGSFFAEMETRLAAAGVGEGPAPYHCPHCGGAV